jgi:hypothetical protein
MSRRDSRKSEERSRFEQNVALMKQWAREGK